MPLRWQGPGRQFHPIIQPMKPEGEDCGFSRLLCTKLRCQLQWKCVCGNFRSVILRYRQTYY
jgi:hypothetical protein